MFKSFQCQYYKMQVLELMQSTIPFLKNLWYCVNKRNEYQKKNLAMNLTQILISIGKLVMICIWIFFHFPSVLFLFEMLSITSSHGRPKPIPLIKLWMGTRMSFLLSLQFTWPRVLPNSRGVNWMENIFPIDKLPVYRGFFFRVEGKLDSNIKSIGVLLSYSVDFIFYRGRNVLY